MEKYLSHMHEKIIEQAPQLAKMITEIQHVRYPALISLKETLYRSRTRLVELYAKTLVMSEDERVEKIRA